MQPQKCVIELLGGTQTTVEVPSFYFDEGGLFGLSEAQVLRNDVVRGVNYFRALANEGKTGAALAVARLLMDEVEELHKEVGAACDNGLGWVLQADTNGSPDR